MWDKLIEYGKQLLSLTQQVEENAVAIKDLSADLQDLTLVVVKLANSNSELRVLFDHLKELEGSERDKLLTEWARHQERYEKDQALILLKLKSLIQESQISRFAPEQRQRSRLFDGD